MKKMWLVALALVIGSTASAEQIQMFEFKAYKKLDVRRFDKLLASITKSLDADTDEVVDDLDNMTAFIRAAKVCLEVKQDGSFENKSSNCEVVRENAKVAQLESWSSLLGMPIEDMVKDIDSKGDTAIASALMARGIDSNMASKRMWQYLYRGTIVKRMIDPMEMRGEMINKISPSMQKLSDFFKDAPKIHKLERKNN